MSDDLERLLAEAFEASARHAVDDVAGPPPPRFLLPDAADELAPRTPERPSELVPVGSRHRAPERRRRFVAPLAAAAAVVAIGGGAAAITYATQGIGRPAADGPAAPLSHAAGTSPASRLSGSPAASASAGRPASAVHIKLLNSDGATYGVGMPVIAYFSRAITDGRALQRATTVTVDGVAKDAAWFFERSAAGRGPIEGHLRLQGFWPAHAKVHVAIASDGRSAGAGLAYDDSLTLDFTTGPKNVAIVNEATHRMTLSSDDASVGSFRVSLGSATTPTARGTKVIMEQDRTTCMHDTDNTYYECGIKWDQRLTYSGEYLHAAPWNVTNIKSGIDSSNGCTNLLPADAAQLYKLLHVGDVVEYPNASGPAMQLGSGYGDWNVSWSTWLTGGLVHTR